MMKALRNVFRFYIDGFREMTLGRTLWAIILIKLFVLFAILKLFFMPDPLAGQSSDERSSHVLRELTPAASAARPGTTPETRQAVGSEPQPTDVRSTPQPTGSSQNLKH